jgi:3-mercaptopyruvate sulfurtransferase SseA
VARQLMQMGFQKVFVLKGGWNEWVKDEFPTEQK